VSKEIVLTPVLLHDYKLGLLHSIFIKCDTALSKTAFKVEIEANNTQLTVNPMKSVLVKLSNIKFIMALLL
jgi:hypothetical protein